MSADDKSNSNEPQILEKSDETPASADDVELDSAAIPQASLEKEVSACDGSSFLSCADARILYSIDLFSFTASWNCESGSCHNSLHN